MAIDFPTATSVGQTYTDPTSGNTYVVTVVGPPAQWVGSGSSTSLDNTYLRKDASNDPVTGTLTVTPATNVEGLVVTQPSGNSAAALRITNEGSGNCLLVEDSANPDSSPIVVDSTGRLLVGTTAARTNFFNTSTFSGPLQVEGTTDLTRVISNTYNSAGAAGPMLVLSKSRGTTVGSNTLVNANDSLGEISFQGSDGTEFVAAASIYAEVDATSGANDMPGRLVFSTTADGASTPTERMRISSTGAISTVVPGGSTLYPAFSARAWVNFDGTGTVSTNQTIRGSGNVTSVFKNATGDYTVNFTTAMPDVNYTANATVNRDSGAASFVGLSTLNVGSVRIEVFAYTSAASDRTAVTVAVFR